MTQKLKSCLGADDSGGNASRDPAFGDDSDDPASDDTDCAASDDSRRDPCSAAGKDCAFLVVVNAQAATTNFGADV